MTSAPRIVLVDDDDGIRTSTTLLLTANGWGVESYESAEELLAHCDLSQMSLLILDLGLPGMNGFDLLNLFRQRQITVPVIVMSGDIHEQTAEQALAGGAVDCLHKAVASVALVRKIRQALAQPKANEAVGAASSEVGDKIALAPH